MNQQKYELNKPFFLKILITSLLVLSALSFFILWLFQYSAYQFHEKEIISHYEMSLLFEEKEIENKLDIFEADLEFLRSDKRFQNMIENPDVTNKNETAATFLYFMKSHSTLYNQLRYLDNKGNEIIRIETKNGKTIQIPDENLQNKSERYYFSDILSLKFNGIYLSPFDLNKENGKIEMPLNPVLRLGSPVFNDLGGKEGIIILNISSSNFFKTIFNKDPELKIARQLLNKNSFWISGGGEKNWAFMFKQKSQDNMKQLNPELWKKLSEKKSGKKEQKEYIWIWNTVYPMKESWETRQNNVSEHAGRSVFWKSVLMIPKAGISSKIKKEYPPDRQIWIWIIISDFMVSALYAFITAKNRYFNQQIEILATKDELTGCVNRRTGIEILEKQILLSRRTGTFVTVCFIDINDLKPVNDLQGHDKGDLLIKTTTEIIEGALRESDTICRMGGDEFLLIFPDCDEMHAEKILTRIEKMINTRNQKKDLPFYISISRGLAEKSPETGLKDTEELITLADQKMYKNKRQYKLKKKESGNTFRD